MLRLKVIIGNQTKNNSPPDLKFAQLMTSHRRSETFGEIALERSEKCAIVILRFLFEFLKSLTTEWTHEDLDRLRRRRLGHKQLTLQSDYSDISQPRRGALVQSSVFIVSQESMELFYNIVSPPSRSVLMLAKHLGIESELTMKSVNLRAGEHMTEDYVQMNPQHCVPTLLTEDGVAIWESNAILIYLAERFDQEEKVYSKDLAKRAQINQRLCFDLGTLYKNIRAYYGPLAMGRSKPSEDLLKQIDQSVGYLEGFLSKTQFVAADSLTIADFAVITSVTVASALKHDFSKFPNVTRWIADCKGSIVGFEEITKKAEDTWKATLEEK